MAVTWDDLGTRRYHVGVDRGMLYIENRQVAVPWSGIISVTESPEGGSASPYYLDGRKILNVASGENFAATLEAFSAPDDFYVCAGRSRLSPGLYAADQPKETFGLSYRTLIGDDVSGTSLGYKLHLVYNATAKMPDITYSTNSQNPSVRTFSWDITTVPEAPKGHRPTAHFVFDTRYVASYIIGRLEGILYGDDIHDPRMPSADEVVTLLVTPPDSAWYDLTSGLDFPAGALIGDMGVDFSNGNLYGNEIENSGATWWDLTGGLDFPPEAAISDWGYDMATGQVWKNYETVSGDILIAMNKLGLSGTG